MPDVIASDDRQLRTRESSRDDTSGPSSAPQMHGAPRVTFVGPLPPPLTGMTAMTAVIVDALEQRTSVRRFNWSRGKPLKGWRWRAARAWGVVRTLAGLLRRGIVRDGVLYFPVNSGGGLYYDLAIASLGRLLGYRLALHHHTYAYIAAYDRRVAWLDRLAGKTGAHVVHCEWMKQDFLNVYNSKAAFLLVPPTIVSQGFAPAETSTVRDGFALGFLSHLSIAKGLDDALATFERLAAQRRDVRLVLAGPYASKREQALVERARARWPEQIDYRGPVFGDAKAQFFADVDAFLFPTRNESWGIVLCEALASKCPVIARSRGCVPWIVQGECGLVVGPNDDFVGAAADQISQWIDHPELHRRARTAADERSKELELDAERQLPQFIDGLLALGAPNA